MDERRRRFERERVEGANDEIKRGWGYVRYLAYIPHGGYLNMITRGRERDGRGWDQLAGLDWTFWDAREMRVFLID
jgi:hypothetical protein